MYNEVTTLNTQGDLFMSYNHFTTFERSRIELLHKQGHSTRQIAKQLDRHHSSIARELQKNSQDDYQAESAHRLSQQRRLHSQWQGKYKPELAQCIENKLDQTWSPEQIAATIMKGKISYKTIYRWLYKGKLKQGNLQVLRHKGKRQKPSETRGKFNIGTSIGKRPKEVKNRSTFGHWELDSVVSSRGKSKGCFATFIERKSRFYFAYKMPDRTAASMKSSIEKLYKALPNEAMQTATVDRGKEFSCYQEIESELKVAVYFADPYSSWQRGSNENANGLLREFYPKKTDLAVIEESELLAALHLINNRPRKCLGWKTSNQVFMEELSHLT